MYKKIISIMSVMLVVFLCFNYDVKADEVIDSSRRYNWLSTTQHYGNVDVTGNLFCLSDNPAMQSVNLSSAEYVGSGTTTNIVSTWESVYLWKFQATYVIKNNSETYECFDNGRLYSQFSVNAKASTSSSGSGTLHDDVVPSGWYIDNIQGATLTNALSDGTMYWSVDHTYYGNTLIIAPGETITFSYDINIFWWEQSFGVGGTTFACNNGSISNTIGYTQDGGYNSYSVSEFITDYPFPSVEQYIADNLNNVWIDVERLVNQGVVDQQKYDQIISILSTHLNTTSYPSVAIATTNYNGNSTKSNNGVYFNSKFIFSGASVVESDIEYDAVNSNASYIVKLSEYVILTVRNNNDSNYSIPWRLHSNTVHNINPNGGTYLGYDYTYSSDAFSPYTSYITADRENIYIQSIPGTSLNVPANSFISIVFKIDRYYAFNDITSASFTFGVPTFNIDDFVASSNSSDNDIVQSTESQVHSQEQSWFTQGNQSISGTGLDNYQFNQEQSGGISGVSDDFVRVWNACGSLNSVWVFSLTLSLALYIIHHIPRQRS